MFLNYTISRCGYIARVKGSKCVYIYYKAQSQRNSVCVCVYAVYMRSSRAREGVIRVMDVADDLSRPQKKANSS